MNIRNGETPIQLPDLIRAGDPITAKWANGIRSALQRLRDRTPIITGANLGGSVYNHPWKIITATATVDDAPEYRIYVYHGAVTYQAWNDNEEPIYKDGLVYFAQTPSISYLVSDPFNATPVGYFVASVSTTYGVWLKVARNAIDGVDAPTGSTEPYAGIGFSSFITGSEILVDSTYNTPSNTPAYDDDFAHIFLGQVAYDGDGVATVKQFRRSDVVTSLTPWPTNFTIVSADAGNSLTEGSDGGAFYDAPPIVSADANNDITTGSDGGAYYDDPDY